MAKRWVDKIERFSRGKTKRYIYRILAVFILVSLLLVLWKSQLPVEYLGDNITWSTDNESHLHGNLFSLTTSSLPSKEVNIVIDKSRIVSQSDNGTHLVITVTTDESKIGRSNVNEFRKSEPKETPNH